MNFKKITFCRPRTANTFCKGPVAGKCKLGDKLQLEKPGVETNERGDNGGRAVAEGCARELGWPANRGRG